VATNACLDELRRRARRPEPIDVEGQRTGGTGRPGTGSALGDQAVPWDHATMLADRFLLDAALARLPEEFRVAVVLRDVLTLDYAEIAETLGVPIGTVRSRIARGRALLAKQLIAAGNPPPSGERPTSTDRRASSQPDPTADSA
jgi:RNA polymerase sigma-70 factor (ECF subfamily)